MKSEEQFPQADLVKQVVDSEKQQQRDYRESQLEHLRPTNCKVGTEICIVGDRCDACAEFDDATRLKITQAGDTKWLDITDSELEQISNILLGKEVKAPMPRKGDMFKREDGLTWKVTEPGLTKSLCEVTTQERAGMQAFINNHEIK